ncbi:MAG TPA: hypothetical protein VLR26_07715 [Frankiaceae bacterium]|nr:hypothetical protein [Frankiaceae bacterium]
MTERSDESPAGATNEPAGTGPDYEAPGAAARVSGNPPPGTNQPSSEPIPADNQESAPTHGNLSSAGAQSPSPPAVSATGVGAPRTSVAPRGAVPAASRAPGIQGEPPQDSDVDLVTAGERTKPGAPPASSSGPEDSRPGTSGNAHGVSVPATESLEGTSEDSAEVRGIAAPQSTGSQSGGNTPGGTSRAHRRSAPDGEVSPS